MNETYHPRMQLVHGFRVRNHPLYYTWSNIKSRCNDVNDIHYKNYGGRGITYCKRWQHFENFANDMYPTFKKGLTIERKNNNANYTPSNCIWDNRTNQCLNRRKFKNNTSGVVGVTTTPDNKFVARKTTSKGVRKYLGKFDNIKDAENAIKTG